METIAVETLRPDVSFTGDLLIDSSFIFLPQSSTLTSSMIDALKLWGFENILCDGNVSLGGDIGISDDNGGLEELPDNEEKIGNNIRKAIESSKHIAIGNSDQARMEMVESVYYEYMNYIEKVFTFYTTHKKIDKEELSETVQDLCTFIKDHRRYMLRIVPTTENCKKNFLVIHSMRTTVLALAIAMQLHMPLSKMIELGVACILHEIGMLRLPPQLYMSEKKLTNAEKAQITKHTIFGYTIMQELEFPPQISVAVVEHHENEVGTGYPRRFTGERISTYGKIIAVACSYEAISSPRSYKDERSTFEAIVELIQNKEHKYDSLVIKALLYTVSFYPIGSYVYLTNKKVALVIDVNPDNPKCPVVQLLTEKDKDGSLKEISTGEDDIFVSRILTKSEKNDILKVLEQKSSSQQQTTPVQEKNEPQSVKTETPKPSAIPQKNNFAAQISVKSETPADNIAKVAVEKTTSPTAPANPVVAPKNTPVSSKPKNNIEDETEEIDISFFN